MTFKTLILLGAGLAAAAPAYHAAPLFPRAGNGTNSTGPTGTAGPTATGSTTPTQVSTSASHMPSTTYPCGPVEAFYNPTQQEWNTSGTDKYLSTWMSKNKANITAEDGTGGFASAFFQYAMGNPDVTCKIDGSTDCDVNACNNPVLNTLPNNETANAFFVLQSMKNLHAYFQGVQQAFQMAALLGALNDDDWTKTFYKQGDGHDADDTSDHGITALKEILTVLATVVAAAAAFIAPETIPALAALGTVEQGLANGAKGAATAIVGGAVGSTNTALKAANPGGSNFQNAADVGKMIGTVVQNSFSNLVNTNNQLMHGDSIDSNGTNIASYMQGGGFLNASVSEVDTMKSFNAMLQGMAINKLWKENKVFILGGGKCGDGQGIGSGPANASWCDQSTNTAWYLYFWQANDVISTTAHQWGWVAPPPGSDQLGNGSYQDISVANAIESSVRAYSQSGYNYTSDVANQRIMDTISSGKPNPMNDGAAWEGIFTIPVCNISKTVGSNIEKKGNILMDYGHDSRLNWCGSICDGDLQQTKLFINATNMENFESPRHYCSKDPGYSRLS